jgi:histidinol-phosphate aminotransferase
MKPFDLKSLVRPNIWSLKPYSSARDEFQGEEGIFLDANENPFGMLNRYPDPHQKALKAALSEAKDIPVEQIFIGNGSDEVIDIIYRIFAIPGKDSVIVCPPTYGMYEVAANINDIHVIEIPLLDNFQLDINNILKQEAKLIFLCSPNNPTGNLLKNIDTVLQQFKGIVVVDEAYIDFRSDKSLLPSLDNYPNLIIMQTFSKAMALAGARVGIAFASAEIVALMDKTKPPYNVSKLNQEAALRALSNRRENSLRIGTIINERENLIEELEKLPVVKKIYPSESNFLLVEVANANAVYWHLVNKKIIIRNRHSQVENCVRITIGTPEENRRLLEELRKFSI